MASGKAIAEALSSPVAARSVSARPLLPSLSLLGRSTAGQSTAAATSVAMDVQRKEEELRYRQVLGSLAAERRRLSAAREAELSLAQSKVSYQLEHPPAGISGSHGSDSRLDGAARRRSAAGGVGEVTDPSLLTKQNWRTTLANLRAGEEALDAESRDGAKVLRCDQCGKARSSLGRVDETNGAHCSHRSGTMTRSI